MNVLITGATGFIGKSFVKHLIQQNLGYKLYCTYRVTSMTQELEELNVELIEFDLTNQSTFVTAVTGMDIVVHFAANFNFRASWESLYIQNVESTIALAEACMKSGVKHFIYCSSSEALGQVIDGTEESEYNPDEAYGRSKMEAEKALLKLKREKNFPVTIVRPTGVYGPGDNYVFREIIESLDRTILNKIIPISSKTDVHFTYIDDIVDGFFKVLTNPDQSIGEIFILASDEPQTYREIFLTITKKLGRRNPIFISFIPIFLLQLIWPIFWRFYVFRGFGYPYVPNAIKKITTNRNYLNTKAKAVLGFKPKENFEIGVEKTVEWMRGQNLIKTKRKS